MEDVCQKGARSKREEQGPGESGDGEQKKGNEGGGGHQSRGG